MIDGAEGTLRQFSLQSPKNAGKTLKVSQVNKIFVTHMHRESVLKCMSSVSDTLLVTASQRTTSWVFPPCYATSWAFLIPKLSRRAVLLWVYFSMYLTSRQPQSHNVAEGQPIRARRPSFLCPYHAFPYTHTNGRPLRGSRAPYPNRSTYALRRRSSP